ncbi:MAG TPA: anti-sigma factor [Actinomycetes bacterium]|nr:anti-sigma factor [Actinomycetes bacterium]
MPHCDAETLALRAIGETVPADDEAHLLACPACQSALDQLQAVVTTARAAAAEPTLVAPPDTVWHSIADRLDLLDRSAPTAAGAAAPTPISVARSRRRPSVVVGLVAAAAVLVGLVVGAGTVSAVHHAHGGEVLAQTALEPVATGDAHGLATLRSTHGGDVLDVDLRGLPAPDGYYEVWLMNAQTGGAVSLGSLDASRQNTFDVPSGLDLAAFPYVDVSLEPFDGNPAHSADSVARGRIGP